MKKEEEWLHFCDDAKSKFFAICNIENTKEIITRKFLVPYETIYFFDTVQIGNTIYFTGGGLPSTDYSPEQYFQTMIKFTIKPEMDTVVTKLTNMCVARANHAMVALTPNTLYVVGGTNISGNLHSCEQFTIDKNKWRVVASLNENKKWISLCTFAKRYLYAFGGVLNEKDNVSDKIECFDTADHTKGTWKIIDIVTGKPLWKKQFFSGSLELNSNSIIIFGGIVKNEEVSDCLVFDPNTRAISLGPKMLAPDAFYRTKHSTNGHFILIVGGRNGDLHTFNKDAKTWEVTAKIIWNPDYGFVVKADTI